MAHQVIKYRLTENGEVPDFLCTEENSEGGAYGVYDDVFPSPRNYVMVGISCDGATGDFETFSTLKKPCAILGSAAMTLCYLMSLSLDRC
jgi:hypothetical protein